MNTGKIYFASDSPRVAHLVKDAQLAALEKRCDPMRVPWQPDPPIAGHQVDASPERLRVCMAQFGEAIAKCELFVAIVDGRYGSLRVHSPHHNKPISTLHFEIMETRRLGEHGPEMRVFTLGEAREPLVEEMLAEEMRANVPIITFNSDAQFKVLFSAALTEHRNDVLTEHLRTLARSKVSVTCRDQPGLLARVSREVHESNGNLASVTQTTIGTLTVIHFVAEWENGKRPTQKDARSSLERVLPEGSQITVVPLDPGGPDFESMVHFHITFMDQPGVSANVFAEVEARGCSVLSMRIHTFVSGGLMLGRLEFTVSAALVGGVSVAQQEFAKLPGILSVDAHVIDGRFWT